MKKNYPYISIGYTFIIFTISFLMGDWIHGLVSGLMLAFMIFFRRVLHKYVYIFIPVTATLYFLGSLGLYYYWYYFDKPVHLVSSFTATFCIANLAVNLLRIKASREVFISVVFIVGLMIGIGWEIFEVVVGYFVEHDLIRGAVDTITDVKFDAIGAIIAAVYAYFTFKPKIRKP